MSIQTDEKGEPASTPPATTALIENTSAARVRAARERLPRRRSSFAAPAVPALPRQVALGCSADLLRFRRDIAAPQLWRNLLPLCSSPDSAQSDHPGTAFPRLHIGSAPQDDKESSVP